MARRRKENGLDLIARLPWPVGVVLGIAAYLVIRYGVGWYLSAHGGPLMEGVGQRLSEGLYAPFAWMALVLSWIAAFVSYMRARQRRTLLETQTGLDSLRAMSWREFEMLVGEAFRRDGYAVEETGLGGADGGIDLVLFKGGRKTLVQCKQWRACQVNVSTVREMWGLASHHDADAVKIVCVGEFTRDAAAFAAGKPIRLVTGQELLVFVRSKQTNSERPRNSGAQSRPEPPQTPTPGCPRCQSAMVGRSNRKTGESFWGCVDYPRCRGTRPA